MPDHEQDEADRIVAYVTSEVHFAALQARYAQAKVDFTGATSVDDKAKALAKLERISEQVNSVRKILDRKGKE